MSMYKLNPTFDVDFDVLPKDICYRLASYHSNSKSSTSSTVPQQDVYPVKTLEQKQFALIEKLKKQTEEFNKLLAVLGKTTSGEKKPTQNASVPSASSATPNESKDSKKDKDAKKEARKAAKADAKNKVATQDVPAKSKGKSADNSSQWTVSDDRKTWETGLSLTANIPTTLAVYPQEALGKATLTISKSDEQWVKALAAIGAKRAVTFTGQISNNAGKDAKTTIAVKSGNDFSLVIDKLTIKSRQTAWKLLGISLGLFSRKTLQTLNSAHQSLWLAQSEQVLNGKANVELLEREASQFLARFDSLSSQWEITLADVVFRSLLSSSSHPNNVEIWTKTVNALSA